MHNRIHSWLETGEFRTSGTFFPVSGPSGAIGALFGYTAGTPVATPNTWAPGAINIDYVNAIVYRNSATYASPTWTNISTTGAANAFSTFACPAGTNPVADSATDTLTFASSGGTVTITGTASTDTINFDLASNKIANVHILTTAAIAFTKLAALTRGSIISGQTASNVPTALAAKTDKYILIGDGADLNSVLWSGDVALTNAGISTVTDLTLTSEAQGTILYFNGTNWVILAVGTAGQGLVTAGAGSNPYWGSPTTGTASYLANNTTCEGGTNDYTLDFGTAGGAYTLTIPAVGGSRTFAFIDQAQSLSAIQTFSNNMLHLLDSAGTHDLIIISTGTGMAADRILTLDCTNAAATIKFNGNVTFASTMSFAGAWTHTGAHTVGITTQNTVAIAFADATAVSLTLPTGTDVLVGRASADTLTNKTLTAPVIVSGGFIADANGAEQLIFTTTTSAVNHFTITNSATASPATQLLAATGTDTNIHCLLQAKGSGKVQCQHGGGGAVEIVNLSDSQALTSKSYNGLTLTSTTGTFTLTAAKVFAVTNTLTLSGTDSTIMTFPAASDTVACLGTAQAFSAIQTFNNNMFHLLDSGGSWDLIVISTGTGMGADRILTLDCTNAAATFKFNGNITFASTVQFDAAMSFAGAWTHTGAHTVGITTQNTVAFTFADATAVALTLPTGTDVLVGRASTDTLTEKSYDCNGSGNVLTNINAAELQTIADNAIGVSFFIRKSYTNLAAAGTNVITTHPKMRIVLAWNVNTSGDGGTVTLHAGQVGAIGNAITDTMTPAGDNDQELFGHLIDAEWERTADTGLVVVGDAGGTIDGEVCLLCIVIP